MNKFKTAMLIISMMNANSSLVAMEEEFKNIDEYFPGFTTINAELLQEIATNAPNNFAHCGVIQRWHVIRWDHWSSNCNNLESLSDRVKINPAPDSFAHSINEATFSYDAHVNSCQSLDENRLLNVVSENITKGRPVMAYFRNGIKILLTTIVGFNATTKQLLLINNGGRGYKRFVEVDFSTFIVSMDFGPALLNCINLGALFGDVPAWLPFTFIVFEKKAQKKLAKLMPLENITAEEKRASKEIPMKQSSDRIKKTQRNGWSCVLQ